MTRIVVVTRAQWGARPPRSRTTMPTPTAGIWLHHTASDSHVGSSGMRAIQNFHMDARGWADIGYSWVWCPTTRLLFEGRGAGVVGAHTPGRNRDHGLAVMGDFTARAPTPQLIDDLAAVLRWHHTSGHGPAQLTGGHRDVVSTGCPGRLYGAIGDINRLAQTHEEETMPLTDDDIIRIAAAAAKAVHNQELFRTGVTIGQAINSTRQTVAALAPQIADLAGRDPASLTDAQVDQLAQALADGLDDRVAIQVLARLKERL